METSFEGLVKINCNRAFTIHGNKAGAWGVVRDWEGKFIFGIIGLTNSSVLIVELNARLELKQQYQRNTKM